MPDLTHANSFGAAADAYERGRPEYPAAAIDWMLPPGARSVLDLAAGTGKLTRGLVGRGLAVTAVEPDVAMRARLEASLPEVTALPGAAESIPLADGSVDAVLVGAAWHWFDRARAVPEIARVLAPGGRLGLVWNQRDDSVDWVAELARSTRGRYAHGMDTSDPPVGPPFAEIERADFPWQHSLTPERLVDQVASRSYVITLPDAERERVLSGVRALAATHPALVGRAEFAMPYRTTCARTEVSA